jgi:hypothetical protein
MTIDQHKDKAELILDNTQTLYNCEQAIFKLYMLQGNAEDFHKRLASLAVRVTSKTNLLESSDPLMKDETFDRVAAHIYQYMLDEYYEEFVHWGNHVC